MSCGNAVVSAKYPIAEDSLSKEPKIRSENDDYLHEFVPEKQNDPNDLSLWVVVFGFRSQDEFREVYGVMKNIGKIKTKLEGFSGVDHGGNWAALQYESHIAAEKALARKRITIPDTKILIGIIPMRKVAAELGIDIKNASMPSLGKIAESKALFNSSQMHALNSEEDVLLIEGQRDYAIDQEDVAKSHLDNFCGKVLSWFFMWDSGKIWIVAAENFSFPAETSTPTQCQQLKTTMPCWILQDSQKR